MKRPLLVVAVCGIMFCSGGIAAYCWNTILQPVEHRPVIADRPSLEHGVDGNSAVDPELGQDSFGVAPGKAPQQVRAIADRFRVNDTRTPDPPPARIADAEANYRFAHGPHFDTEPPRPDFAEPIFANPIRPVVDGFMPEQISAGADTSLVT